MTTTAKFASKIHEAAFTANVEGVRSLLKEGASVEPGEDKVPFAPSAPQSAPLHAHTDVVH